MVICHCKDGSGRVRSEQIPQGLQSIAGLLASRLLAPGLFGVSANYILGLQPSRVEMRNSRVFSAVLLIVIVSSVAFLQAPLPAKAQSSTIDTSQEYSSGDVQVFPYLEAWYTWISINGTHTIFLALHSNQLPSPVSAFVGQGYNTSSGSRVFLANVLLAMEVYNDTNNNGYLDADYSAGTTELRYTILMNASQTFTPTTVHKTTNNGVPHYTWGVTYGNVQANLVNLSGIGGAVANITYVSMLYDYSIKGNTTFLKTSYEIGNVTLVPPVSPGITLQGLSLSLLHATVTVSSGQLAVVAGSSPYDSQANTAPSLMDAAQVTVDNTLAYKFQFKDNYTLQTTSPSNHPAVYLAAPSNSIPPSVFQGQGTPSLIRVQDYVKASLPSIVGLPATSDFNYNTSRFLYRISYPAWSGIALQHDPTYIAYIGQGSPLVSTPPSILPIIIISAVILAGLLAIVLAIYALKRSRRTG